jgi:hypothetical protein
MKSKKVEKLLQDWDSDADPTNMVAGTDDAIVARAFQNAPKELAEQEVELLWRSLSDYQRDFLNDQCLRSEKCQRCRRDLGSSTI